MDNLLVTCPETGRREEIGCLVGLDNEVLVVLRCSRFDPDEAMACSCGCVHPPSCQAGAGSIDRWRLPPSDC
jgi:hypothetical protein